MEPTAPIWEFTLPTGASIKGTPEQINIAYMAMQVPSPIHYSSERGYLVISKMTDTELRNALLQSVRSLLATAHYAGDKQIVRILEDLSANCTVGPLLSELKSRTESV